MDDIEITARLAQVEVKDPLQMQLAMEQMIEYFNIMSQADVADTAIGSHLQFQDNRLRDDVAHSDNISDELLQLAPRREGRFFVVPNVL